MKFTKMHGAGNDYIFLNCLAGMPEDPAALARRLSDRHFGVGADGLICLCPGAGTDFSMCMFNADGSEGEMCGNGIRCLAKFAFDQGLTRQTTLTIATPAGPRRVELLLEGGRVTGATVAMGAPQVGEPLTIAVKGETYTGIPVSMGNPHFVVECAGPEGLDLPALGPALASPPCFPRGANVEFVRVEGRARARMRVWERGSGETLACGTGACAAAAALMAAGKLARRAAMRLPGGVLEVAWSPRDGQMYLTGPAVTVYHGELV